MFWEKYNFVLAILLLDNFMSKFTNCVSINFNNELLLMMLVFVDKGMLAEYNAIETIF